MTPLEIGATVFCATTGLLSAIGLIFLLKVALDAITETIEWYKHQRLYGKFMDPKYWFHRKTYQCPNPDYIGLDFENSATNEMVKLAVKKQDLKEFI